MSAIPTQEVSSEKVHAFVKNPEEAAKKYPDLTNAYSTYVVAEKLAASKGMAETQTKEFLEAAKLSLADKIARGEEIPAPDMKKEAAARLASEIPQHRVYLDVPFGKHETAKSLGAKFDNQNKAWYLNATKEQAAAAEKGEKAFVKIPFERREAAKELGLRFDGESKAWYMPAAQREVTKLYIDFPYEKNAAAKDLGMKFDGESKAWYMPATPDQAAAQQKGERVYLKIPYEQRAAASEIGLKWDQQEKSWYRPSVAERAQLLAKEREAAEKSQTPAAEKEAAPSKETAFRDTGDAVEKVEKQAPAAAKAKAKPRQKDQGRDR